MPGGCLYVGVWSEVLALCCLNAMFSQRCLFRAVVCQKPGPQGPLPPHCFGAALWNTDWQLNSGEAEELDDSKREERRMTGDASTRNQVKRKRQMSRMGRMRKTEVKEKNRGDVWEQENNYGDNYSFIFCSLFHCISLSANCFFLCTSLLFQSVSITSQS